MKSSFVQILFATSCFCILLVSFKPKVVNDWSEKTPLYEILASLGEKLPDHARPNADEATIKRGYDLVHKGKATSPEGKIGTFISKFYKCTTCHNQQREDPILTEMSPEARLQYASEKGLKFLQGSTFFGIANRESWYNDDYYLKYGDLVKPANKSLAEATQLCAKVCSSGRYLEDWELEAILAYYWDNQIKLGDLDLSLEEKEKILNSSASTENGVIELLKSKYASYSPATFGKMPVDLAVGYNYKGNPENGKLIYELSCQSCHSYDGSSGMALDNSKLTFQKFKRNLKDGDDYYNIYHISRNGTYAGQGKPRYMPLYPKERMSDRQLEDLKAYIIQESS